LAGRTLSELLAELATRPGAGFDAVEAARTLAQKARAAGKESAPGGAPWLGDERGERLATCFEGFAASLEASSEHANRTRDQGFYRALAASDGLVGRTWFKNRLWTSGLETGYSAETFPTLRAAAKSGPEALDRELEDMTHAVSSALGASASGATASGR
jgi:hypothetical protein